MLFGGGTAFVGYWLIYFGFCSIRGPGVGFLDLIVPGRQVTIPAGGSGGGAGVAPGATPSGTLFPPGTVLPPTSPGGQGQTVDPNAPPGSPQNPYNMGTI